MFCSWIRKQNRTLRVSRLSVLAVLIRLTQKLTHSIKRPEEQILSFFRDIWWRLNQKETICINRSHIIGHTESKPMFCLQVTRWTHSWTRIGRLYSPNSGRRWREPSEMCSSSIPETSSIMFPLIIFSCHKIYHKLIKYACLYLHTSYLKAATLISKYLSVLSD